MKQTIKFIVKSIMLVLMIFIAGCGAFGQAEPTGDPSLIYTQAAETVSAQLTEAAINFPTEAPTATVPPPTETPEPSPTVLFPTAAANDALETPALPGQVAVTLPPTPMPVNPTATKPIQQSGDSAIFQYQVPIDGKTFAPSTQFMVSWGFLNNGTTTWGPDYKLVFIGGEPITGMSSVRLEPTVKPGQKGEFNIMAQMPGAAGNYITRWKMVNPSGAFMAEVYLSFKVSN